MSGVNRDLQANHQIVMSLEQSKTQSELIIDHLAGLFIVFDRGLSIWKANLGAAAALERDFEAITGSTLHELFDEQECEIFRSKVELFLKSPNRAPVEFELATRIRSGGRTTVRPFLWNLGEFKLPGGSSLDLVRASAQDITEIQQAAQVFASLPLGLLLVSPAGIQERFSAYTEVLLGRNDIAGKKLSEILFPEGLSRLKPEEISAVEQMDSIWGQDPLVFEMERDQYPKVVLYRMPENSIPPQRYLGVTIQPVESKGTVQGLIVLLEDKTSLILAREQEAKDRAAEEMSIARILQVKRVSPSVAQVLFKDLNASVSALRPAWEARLLRSIRAAIHATKGNARIAGMEYLGRLCHDFETAVAQETSGAQEPNWTSIAGRIEEIVSEWDEIHRIQAALAASAPSSGTTSSNDPTAILISRMKDAKAAFTGAESDRFRIERLNLAVAAQNLAAVDSLEPLLRQRVEETAKQLKVDATLEMHTNGVRIDLPTLSVLSECLVHLINNSLAHGASPQGESADGSPPPSSALNIKLTAELHERTFECVFDDDGRGIQVDRVKAAALKMGIITLDRSLQMTREEAIQLILHPGLSTAEKVDEVSGRGIGMDAIHMLMEKAGGSLKIESTAGKGARFHLAFPRNTASLTKRKLCLLEDVIQALRAGFEAVKSDISGFSPELMQDLRLSGADAVGIAYADPRMLATAASTAFVSWSRGKPIRVQLRRDAETNSIILAAEQLQSATDADEQNLRKECPEYSAALPECIDTLKQHGMSGAFPSAEEKQFELRLQTIIEPNLLPSLEVLVDSSVPPEKARKLEASTREMADRIGLKSGKGANNTLLLRLDGREDSATIREALLSSLEKRLLG